MGRVIVQVDEEEFLSLSNDLREADEIKELNGRLSIAIVAIRDAISNESVLTINDGIIHINDLPLGAYVDAYTGAMNG